MKKHLVISFVLTSLLHTCVGLSLLQRLSPLRSTQLPPQTAKLIYKLKPSFQAEGIFPATLSLKSFVEKMTPGDEFAGDQINMYIDKLLNKKQTLVIREKLEHVYELYYKLFIDYFITKQIPTDVASTILYTTDAIYTFDAAAAEEARKIAPLRESLARLVIKIFMENKELHTLRIIEVTKRKRRALFSLLKDFRRSIKKQLDPFADKGNIDAKQILKRLPDYVIALQEYALDISLWRMTQNYAKYVAAVAVPLAIGVVLYRYYREDPLARIAQMQVDVSRTAADVSHAARAVATLSQTATTLTGEVSKRITQATSEEVSVVVASVADVLLAQLGEKPELRTLLRNIIQDASASAAARERILEEWKYKNNIDELLESERAVGVVGKIKDAYNNISQLKLGWNFGVLNSLKKIMGRLQKEPTNQNIEEAKRALLRATARIRWGQLKYVYRTELLSKTRLQEIEQLFQIIDNEAQSPSIDQLKHALKLVSDAERELKSKIHGL